jgi:glycosyltransferase involved in cell wall biosynthesis
MPDRPIKILHVVFSLEQGGMENGLINITRGLDAQKFETHVACLEREGDFAQRLPEPKRIYVLGKDVGFSMKALGVLSKLISRIKPDVVHSHNLGPLMYGGLATAMGIRAPILHGEHSLLPPEECRAKKLRQRHLFYRACKKVHAVSAGLREQLVQLGLPAEKIITLINGVDTERFAPDSRSMARREIGDFIPANAFVFGIVGRFGPFKRHGVLIEAFNQLASQAPDLHLLVVGGGGPEKERVVAQGKASPVANRIHFVGFQNDPVPYYRAMNLLVVPSINEGMSNAVLEGMACGIPVLANNVCGNAEMIVNGGNGLLADLETAGQLTTELRGICTNRHALEEMGQRARESAIKSFSISTMVYNYARLYQEIASQSGAPKPLN